MLIYASDMECYDNTCHCPLGTDMTADRRACLARSEKLLGMRCLPHEDKCFHKPGKPELPKVSLILSTLPFVWLHKHSYYLVIFT